MNTYRPALVRRATPNTPCAKFDRNEIKKQMCGKKLGGTKKEYQMVNTCTPIAPVVRPIVFSTARIRDCEPLKP
jgi:hypothetical protein